jgi:hypothetical protein
MTAKEQLVTVLRAFSDKEALARRESLFKASEREQKVDETYQVISGWLAGIDGIDVKVVDGGQLPFMSTVFNAKHLQINLAKQTIQFNPVATEENLFFTIVGLAQQDLRMESDFSVTLPSGLPGGFIQADMFYQQLAHRVLHS